ncbi:MAG: hypothetical protein ACRBM6_09620 [Geminicoccales bacterium]
MKLRFKYLALIVTAYVVALGVSPFVALFFGDSDMPTLGGSGSSLLWFVFGYATSTHLLLTALAALIIASSIEQRPALWTLGVCLAVCFTLPTYFSWLFLLEHTSPNENKQAVLATVVVCTAVAGSVFYLLQRLFRPSAV